MSSTGFAPSCAIAALCARVARSIPAIRSLIADRSIGAEESRGVALTSLTAAASFSDCARRPARSPRNAAKRFLQRIKARGRRGIRGGYRGLAGFGLNAGNARGEVIDGSGVGLGRGRRRGPGHPNIQATQITSEAATTPETAATTHVEIAAEACSETGSGGASPPAFRVSPVTSDASRSMVGGARLARPESTDGSILSGLSSTIPYGSLFIAADGYQIRRIHFSPGSSAIPGAKHGPACQTRHFRPPRPPP